MEPTKPFRREEEDLDLLSINNEGAILFLHNDDYHTFDYVIECLVNICGHNPQQAEQCAWIVHTTGKCDVKHGLRAQLLDMYEKLKRKGLVVTLD
ncbi:MAG: ATP-dependent Clp protease adaptor ClpS [Flavobacteriales bacterium]|nr:ATP-dependent Clp protease adaptor ClpS [Flavobacteriales bacterium]MCX7768642.1 ATP-dependent Clp protease adaptor ClpS [Flavobacteriales bacterium]MDW8410368.1 ATP-dependent Clp protease adaptor ClpS [Flavobacteriales bacterium]